MEALSRLHTGNAFPGGWRLLDQGAQSVRRLASVRHWQRSGCRPRSARGASTITRFATRPPPVRYQIRAVQLAIKESKK